MEKQEIGQMVVKLTVDADGLNAAFDAAGQRIEELKAKLEELRIAAEKVGIKTTTEARLTSGEVSQEEINAMARK